MVLSALDSAVKVRETLADTLKWLKKKASTAKDLTEAVHYLGEASKVSSDLRENYQKIVSCSPTDIDDHRAEYEKVMDAADELILELKVKKTTFTPVPIPATNTSPSPSSTPSVSTQIRLPKIEPPSFSGSLNDWMSFKDQYVSAVHNNKQLSESQKLTYLQRCLTGDAAKIISSMECTDANYNIAWTMLQERYQNERELLFSILKKFTNQPSVSSESNLGLRTLLDTSKECIRALENLKQPVDQWDGILIFLMRQKLDSESKKFWELSLPDTKIPTMKDFMPFLEQRARALASLSSQSKSTKPSSEFVKKVSVHHARENSSKCKTCPGDHFLQKCHVFLALTVEDRRSTAQKASLCFNCLRSGHRHQDCPSKFSCQTCKGRHHTLLHIPYTTPSAGNFTSAKPESSHIVRNHHSKGATELNQTMLATAVVKLTDKHGKYHLCRALLDGGSTASFITEACVRRLGLKRNRTAAEVVGLGSAAVGTARGIVEIEVRAHFNDPDEFVHTVNTLILPAVTSKLPVNKCNPQTWPHLKGLQLADPHYYSPDDIDMLLGADVFWDLMMGGKVTGPAGTPVAIRTTLGWLIAGNLKSVSKQVMVHFADCNLDETLQKFWELESIPDSPVLTKEEKMCEDHFHSSTVRDESGRFVVKFPIKEKSPVLGSSREAAVRRLKQIERRLEKNPDHRREYQSFMNEYLSLGHMELLSDEESLNSQNPTYYVPHHFVLKESSTSTKFRVVFDASAKSSSGVSLNDKLLVGPTIQENLISIIMRFRTHPFAFSADIAKMYRQVKISRDDADLQRIVWRDDPTGPVKDYRLLTVTYGTASGPYHAIKALQTLAEQEKEDLPLAAVVVSQDSYVDDVLSGESTIPAALKLQSQLLELTRRGGFELRKWTSNCPALLESLPVELRETQIPLSIDLDEVTKTLGLRWNPGLDEFSFKVSLPESPTTVTKRSLLSEIAKVFDPLGWLAPSVIRAKILFQQLWKLDLGWDDPLPAAVRDEWLQYRGNLPCIEEIQIPRCTLPTGATKPQLHGFCDASEKAYSAAVYVRVILDSGAPHVFLIAAKTRVAPTKQVCLPRLELCGAVLLAELMEMVKKSLKILFDVVRAWSDSTVVLAWLQSHPTRWKTFVANRVAEIQQTLPHELWGHVRGIENPADCASRGIDPSELKTHPLWWRGPRWLYDENPSPHAISVQPNHGAVNMEEKIVVQVHHAHTKRDISMLNNISTLRKLNRITAWCIRFSKNCRSSTIVKTHVPVTEIEPLTSTELDNALKRWVSVVQNEEFGNEIQCMLQGKPVPTKSRLKSLNPFLDSQQILRVGGRLRRSALSPDQKHPMVLPRHHTLTRLIIQNEHEVMFHAGNQLLLSNIQRRFWILGAKAAVRHQIQKCVLCTRHRHPANHQMMADLPAVRVNPARAFLKCGVDYAGPFTLRAIAARSKVTFKGYLCLFICFTTRAIHLEVVSALTTDAFLAAFRRFIGRRGRCSDIYSDCGTNFCGADGELKELMTLVKSEAHSQKVSTHFANEGINWHFNPPGAPHFGGLWEAGVKSVKYHLHRVMGATRLTFEELTTITAQIEACLNSRPLTPVSSDPADLTALTPGHFLIGKPLMTFPEPNLTDVPMNRLTRWQLSQQLYQHFWRRWSGEFLSRLQQRPK